jgi:ParB family chromosome partitioning protein
MTGTRDSEEESNPMKEKVRLGRGLDALISGLGAAGEDGAGREQATVAIDRIQHNPHQPRKAFDEEELSSLRESIRTHGILQPLVVRPTGDGYQLVAGERRLRAAQAAGLTTVPVRLVDFNDQQVLEAALVENIQRSDLNPIEKAQGFKEYLDRFQMTHEQLAARLGLARTTITNLVALLDLPPEVREAVRLNQINLGHAKLLKGVTDRPQMVELCRQIIARNCSVREAEALIKQHRPGEETAEPAGNGEARPAAVEKTPHVQAIEDELRQKLATRVEIRLRGPHRGRLIIGFESSDDFERVLDVLRR